MRWWVTLMIRTPDGREGRQTIVITAPDRRRAEQLAWDEAHGPKALGGRRGAVITSARESLYACVLDLSR